MKIILFNLKVFKIIEYKFLLRNVLIGLVSKCLIWIYEIFISMWCEKLILKCVYKMLMGKYGFFVSSEIMCLNRKERKK